MKNRNKKLLTCFKLVMTGLLVTSSVTAFSLPTIHTADFISNADRTNFNGFENINESLIFTSSHTENGVKVERTGGDVDSVWTTMGADYRTGFEGLRSWYVQPRNVNQTGYDSIKLTSGASIDSIGLLVGSGFYGYCLPNDCDEVAPYLTLHYDLMYRGVSVSSGSLAHNPNAHYIGFSGGGFDELRIWDTALNASPNQSALVIDSIEVIASSVSSVPEPKMYAMMLVGLVAVATRRKTIKI
jgi:hypothetical protein